MSPSKLVRRHWHDIGLGSAVVAGAWLLFGWQDFAVLQKLLILNFIIVLLHQFEEYSWPGGFPAVANVVMVPLLGNPRYFKPLNQLSSAMANITFAYVFYLLPVFFPHTIWLGLATIIVGAVLQVIGHAILVNYQIRSFYSPGVATAVFGWLPLGVVYVYYVHHNGFATGWDWLGAVAYMVVAMVVIFYVIEQLIFGGDNPRFPFEQDEMERFHIPEKLAAARRKRDGTSSD